MPLVIPSLQMSRVVMLLWGSSYTLELSTGTCRASLRKGFFGCLLMAARGSWEFTLKRRFHVAEWINPNKRTLGSRQVFLPNNTKTDANHKDSSC